MLIEATNPFKCDRAIAMTKERTCCNAAMSEKRRATIREMKKGPFEVGNQVDLKPPEPDVQWKAAVFARWHEPDDASVKSGSVKSG
jgi:hypothetical protein